MGTTHLVVDGSNIATEGRSMPSLQQLLEAVAAVGDDGRYGPITVIVDATFGHRIDESERAAYEEKANAGEIITPPAGVIGRGDAFILEVADRASAVILSNDSFQEFHGTFEWLFEEGRLIGGKHVPGVGWIFLARSPVRGPTSRRAVSDAKRKRRSAKKEAAARPAKKQAAKQPAARAEPRKSAANRNEPAARNEAAAGRKRGGKEPEPYNEPLPFIEFVGAHPVGSVIQAEIEQFSSHGAYVLCDGTRCYIPLKALADPAPRSAREFFSLGEIREFVVAKIDTPRRGIDLVMPESALPPVRQPVPEAEPRPLPAPEEQTSPEAEIDPTRPLSVSQRRKLRAASIAVDVEPSASDRVSDLSGEAGEDGPSTRKTARKAPAKKAATAKSVAKKAATKKATTKKAATKTTTGKAPAKKAAPAPKAAVKKALVKKAPVKKAAAKKAPATTATTKAPAKKAAPARKATVKKAPAKKAPVKRTAAKKAATAKAATKKAPVKKAAVKKAAGRGGGTPDQS